MEMNDIPIKYLCRACCTYSRPTIKDVISPKKKKKKKQKKKKKKKKKRKTMEEATKE